MIDDLTVQNRKLKQRLRKYEASYNTQLEKDILFEVKIHGLSAKKKRQLEETLRSFAASIDGSSDISAKANFHQISVPSKNTPLSSTRSRPVDSAYASMSTSGPTSASTLYLDGRDRNAPDQQSKTDQNIQSFLRDIPEGLQPKHSLVMIERQKKKLVVRRLEQLFTGKKGLAAGDHSQSLQQQEVSDSAAMMDRAASSKRPSGEGIREAHILPYEMEIDNKNSAKLGEDSSLETSADDSPESFLEQRPTRPLDLDPDRAQIPSDNADYLRHLGVSAPSFENDISGDVEADSDGWIYLNLLINMAQLHIINVTADFVRSAVADVSDKFQLSRDGRKIRWRGGTDGTRFTSDSGTSSGQDGSPMDSNSLDEADRKRRKTDVGRFVSVPINISDQKASSRAHQQTFLQYTPLFHHQESSSERATSSGDSESPLDCGPGYADDSRTGRASRVPHLRSRGSHSMSGRRARRRSDGPIVFYSNAQFFTDLSGDRGTISTPLHETGVGKDGYSNHSRDALGYTPRSSAPNISRTPSGSLLPFRPFKDYSKGFDPFQTSETRPKTPDLLDDEGSDIDICLALGASPSAPAKSPVTFDATGLGGTQPADHFAVAVKTRRTILNNTTQGKLSKFSAPGLRSRRFFHTIPNSSLEMFQQSDCANSEEITRGLASHHASSPPKNHEDFPVRTEIVSAQFFRLQPSALPPPMGYHATLSSSADSDSAANSDDTSSSGISYLRGQKPFIPRLHNIVPASRALPAQEFTEKEQVSGEMQDDESDDDESDDSDASIDLLASARQADPKTIAKREEELERQGVQKLEQLPAGISQASVDGGSGFSSPMSDSSEDMDLD